jgi:hypothetical protein
MQHFPLLILRETRRVSKCSKGDGRQTGLAIVYYALGRRADSDAALARLLKERADVDAFEIAEVFAFHGELDEAMYWLERAYQKDAALYFVKFYLPLKDMATTPRMPAAAPVSRIEYSALMCCQDHWRKPVP